MRTIRGEEVLLKDCKRGDIISLTETTEMEAENYLNIVVTPSLTVANKTLGNDFSFNVISLNDGRPRSFNNDAIVYRYKKEDVFV